MEVDAAFAEHRRQHCAHGVFRVIGGEDPHSPRLVVDVKFHAWDVPQGPLVVLRLEAQVPLDENLDLGEGPVEVLSEDVDVLRDHLELAIGLWWGEGRGVAS